MNNFEVYQGEDFQIRVRAKDQHGEPVSLEDYDVEVMFSNAAGRCFTAESEGIGLEMLDEGSFRVSVSHQVTRKLQPSQLLFSVMLIHKTDQTRAIEERRIISVVKSKIGGKL